MSTASPTPYRFTNRVWVNNYLRTNLGEPILSLLESEVIAIDSALKNALMQYWISLPYIHQIPYEDDGEDRRIVTEDSVLSHAFPTDSSVRDGATVLGVVRIDERPLTTISRLLGETGRNLNKSRREFHARSLNMEKELLKATERDTWTGEVSFLHDPVNRTYLFDVPETGVRYIVWWTIAFFSDLELKYLKSSHLAMFAKMVLYEYLNLVVKARSSVEISNDVQINISALESQMGDIKGEFREELSNFVITPAIYG